MISILPGRVNLIEVWGGGGGGGGVVRVGVGVRGSVCMCEREGGGGEREQLDSSYIGQLSIFRLLDLLLVKLC